VTGGSCGFTICSPRISDMGEKELVFDAKEMAVLAFVCQCGTSVLFDCSKLDSIPPGRCPSCGNDKDGIRQMLSHYKRFYAGLGTVTERMEFHVRVAQ
jgi:hypothetical protein